MFFECQLNLREQNNPHFVEIKSVGIIVEKKNVPFCIMNLVTKLSIHSYINEMRLLSKYSLLSLWYLPPMCQPITDLSIRLRIYILVYILVIKVNIIKRIIFFFKRKLSISSIWKFVLQIFYVGQVENLYKSANSFSFNNVTFNHTQLTNFFQTNQLFFESSLSPG